MIGGWGTGGGPSSLAARDLNADGKLDLVATNSNAKQCHSAARIGSGKLQNRADDPGRVNSWLGGDWRPERGREARSGGSEQRVEQRNDPPGNGAGGFQPASALVSVGSLPASVVIRDWNGDGVADLGGGEQRREHSQASSGDRRGEISAKPPDRTLSTGTGPIAIAAGDFNGGLPDLAVVDHLANDSHAHLS
jgi:hypothetical protein